MTLYRTFANKDAIVEAVLLRELERFLSELAAEASSYDGAEDKLVEGGFVFTLNTLRGHALLQRLLATEPETVLPFLTTEATASFGPHHRFWRTSWRWRCPMIAELNSSCSRSPR